MDYDVNVLVSDQIYNNVASFEIMGYILKFVHNFLRSDPLFNIKLLLILSEMVSEGIYKVQIVR